MQVLAVTNIKGGVGKTTTAVNLAFLAAADGRRTVLWDLDSQGAATWMLHGVADERGSAKRIVAGKQEINELVATTHYPNLRLVPADFSYRNFDSHLAERKHRTQRLMRITRSLHADCDLLVLDCPPGMSLLAENVLRAADALVVPLVPALLSLRMLDELLQYIESTGWSDLRLLPFFSMVDRRRSLHGELIAEVRARHASVLQCEVPYWSDIERMAQRRAPLPAYAPASPAARVYEALWQEVRQALGN